MIRPGRWGLLQNHGKIMVRNPVLVLTMLTVVLMLDVTGLARLGLLCALLHEGGHVIAYYLLFRRTPRLLITVTGITLCLHGMLLTPLQQLLLGLAGPIANFTAAVAVMLWMQVTESYTYGGYWFAAVNFLVGASNLLPIPGLDGAMALRAILCFKMQSAIKLQSDAKYDTINKIL